MHEYWATQKNNTSAGKRRPFYPYCHQYAFSEMYGSEQQSKGHHLRNWDVRLATIKGRVPLSAWANIFGAKGVRMSEPQNSLEHSSRWLLCWGTRARHLIFEPTQETWPLRMQCDLIRPAIAITPCTCSAVRTDRPEGIYNTKTLDPTSAMTNLREGQYGGLQLSGIWRRNYHMESTIPSMEHLLVLGNFRQVSLNSPCRKGPLCFVEPCVFASKVKT